ncbi:MAG TPA: hypothetical protein VGL02_03450 [Streptomyces sp.]
MSDLRTRLAAKVGERLAGEIIEILNEEVATRCRDADCLRRRSHPRLAWHLWRHVPVAPLSPRLFGLHCFTCGRPTWHRIHRTGRPS